MNEDNLKALRDWRSSYCCKMPTAGHVDGIVICCVLGEKFGLNCMNDKGERCRYLWD